MTETYWSIAPRYICPHCHKELSRSEFGKMLVDIDGYIICSACGEKADIEVDINEL